MKRLNKIFSLPSPIIQGGMGIGVSMGNLAGHVAKNGGMGVISTANIGFREEDFWENPKEANLRALAAEIRKAKEIAQGNGLVAINAMTVTSDYRQMVDKACEEEIDAVISGAGLPLQLPEIIGDRDVMAAPIVSSGKAAALIKRTWNLRYDRDPDFIVVEGSDAGGHLGFKLNELEGPKSLYELVAEVKAVAGDIPVFAAGSVFDREDIEMVKAAGAYGVQLGTRFIGTYECDASYGFKEVILNARAEDVTILKSPVGLPGRGIKSPLIEKVERGERIPPKKCVGCITTCDPGKTHYCISRALIEAYKGNWNEGLFFAGSNVGRVNEMKSVKELMDELVCELRD